MAAMETTFIKNSKRQLLAWNTEGTKKNRQLLPGIDGEKLDWKMEMEIPARFQKDLVGLWELWLAVKGLRPEKSRNWKWVAYPEAELDDALWRITWLVSGASRDATYLRRLAVFPLSENLEVQDSWTAAYRAMLDVAEKTRAPQRLVSMLRNRLLVTTAEQEAARRRNSLRKPVGVLNLHKANSSKRTICRDG